MVQVRLACAGRRGYYEARMDMPKRTILVTGANGALGLALAEGFLDETPGNFVWLGVRRGRDRADALALEHPGKAEVVDLDVTDPDAWTAAVERILAKTGRIDVLVNNAGVHEDALLANMPVESWRRVIDANLHGAFHGCQAVMKAMISQHGGRIVNIASLSALLAPPGQTNYAAAKAGLVGMTQSLAKEVARLGITVNAVCPGYIESEALGRLTGDARKSTIRGIPMRRFGKPEEVAAAVRFLACADAAYITGSVLKIDGGIL